MGLIAALNASTGDPIWQANFTNRYGNPDTGGAPTVSDGVVYTQGYNNLYALNATNGALLWNYTNLGSWGTSISPAVAEGLVFSASYYENGGSRGYVFAVNATDGSEVWTFPTGNVLMSSPAVCGGVVYVGSDDHNLYALDASTGSVVWNYTTGDRVFSSPAVANGQVYVGSTDGNMYAFDAASGAKIWNYTVGDEIEDQAAVADGIVFASCDDRNLYAFNASTGALLWKYLTALPSEASNGFTSAPVVADGKIYVGTSEGNVLAFGNASETSPTPAPSPTASPSTSVPEFPPWIILPLIAATSVLIALRRRKRS
jgi:outer membrane protein assembly factor BamB